MKVRRIFRFSPLVFVLALASAWGPSGGFGSESENWEEASARIDGFIEEGLRAAGERRNALASDDIFIRRIYLDIVGRIPTYEEVGEFRRSKSEAKRSELIDALLDSSGYASHFYNYWEDVLRIKSRDRKTIMVSYQDWVKASLQANKPYDEMVRELISSSGFVWDDPAVGYYLRDAGMPLDNMSNTAQVFLGTRMQCAQCHDHPFDRWTQKEYYHMAAYTFGVQSSVNGYRKLPEFMEFQQVARQAKAAEMRANGETLGKGGRNRGSVAERRAMRDIFEPLGFEVTTSKKPLRLPDDYMYDDAKPKQVMAAKTPFGEEAKLGRRDDPQAAYATWMTSADNPRFTKVIANRLWKKAMGVGLIEPVDDIKDDTEASHPELMTYLEELMVASGYDMKVYLRTIFNTRTYQSVASSGEPLAEERYLFAGPSLRRMTAEQLWDSVLALAIPDIDERMGGDTQMLNLRVNEAEMKKHVENVQALNGRELYAIVKRLGAMQQEYIEIEKKFQTAINGADDKELKSKLRRKFNEVRRSKNQAIEVLLARVTGSEVVDRDEMLSDLRAEQAADEDLAKLGEKRAKQVAKYRRNLVRASEVVSPAPSGHFLRQFGESDREIIESSSDEAAIPQALSLLNGNLFNLIINQSSVLSAELQRARARERLDVIFNSFYARSPTERERDLVLSQVETHGPRKGYSHVMLALLNSQEFRFIQ